MANAVMSLSLVLTHYGCDSDTTSQDLPTWVFFLFRSILGIPRALKCLLQVLDCFLSGIILASERKCLLPSVAYLTYAVSFCLHCGLAWGVLVVHFISFCSLFYAFFLVSYQQLTNHNLVLVGAPFSCLLPLASSLACFVQQVVRQLALLVRGFACMVSQGESQQVVGRLLVQAGNVGGFEVSTSYMPCLLLAHSGGGCPGGSPAIPYPPVCNP